jgi:hypothetical protein
VWGNGAMSLDALYVLVDIHASAYITCTIGHSWPYTHFMLVITFMTFLHYMTYIHSCVREDVRGLIKLLAR